MTGSHPRDILDGRKTMTRRTWGLEEINQDPDAWCISGHVGAEWGFGNLHCEDDIIIKCPYGGVGDLLWVREAFTRREDGVDQILYKADYENIRDKLDLPKFCKEYGFPLPKPRFKPSIHMFRKDSRIQMPISSLRPERLQLITEEDARAEGLIYHEDFSQWYISPDTLVFGHKTAFSILWDSLNGKKYPWSGNWWVWVIEWPKHSPKKD